MHNVQKCMQSEHPMNPVNLTACGLTTLGKVVGLMDCNIAVSLSTSVGFGSVHCSLTAAVPVGYHQSRVWCITAAVTVGYHQLRVWCITAAVPVGYHQLRVWCITAAVTVGYHQLRVWWLAVSLATAVSPIVAVSLITSVKSWVSLISRVSSWGLTACSCIHNLITNTIWNRTRPKVLVQSQHTRKLISTQKTSQKHKTQVAYLTHLACK